jgi:hypothetical protein
MKLAWLFGFLAFFNCAITALSVGAATQTITVTQ